MGVETRYARTTDGTHVAYQVTGRGEVDIVFMRAWIAHIETEWDDPVVARLLRRFESMGRLIRLDRRGMGMSDRITHRPPPTIEERLDDIRAVLDAAESRSAVFVALGYAAALVAPFAATYPDRTLGVVFANPIVRDRWGPDYPWAATDAEFATRLERIRQSWGTVEHAHAWLGRSAPSRLGDRKFLEWWAAQEMQAGTAQDAIALAELQRETDVTSALGAIHVPTLVIVRGDLEAERSRYAVERIPGAKVIVQPGPDMVVISGDTDSFLNEVENFIDGLRGSTAGQDTDRILSTLLFTDVVDSTSRAVELGDREWGALITRLHDRAESIVHRFRGRVVDTAGDGMLAAFDGTGRAIRCARELVDNARELELEIRAGVHTGECQVVGERLRGVAVHVAARVAALAGASEVLVSSTVRDLVAGSGFEFADRGEHQLKGVPGAWRVFAADGARQA